MRLRVTPATRVYEAQLASVEVNGGRRTSTLGGFGKECGLVMRNRTSKALRVLLLVACVSTLLATVDRTATTLIAAGITETAGQAESCGAPLDALRIDGGLRRVVHEIWHRSPTVRAQLARIAGEPGLVVSFGYCGGSCPSGVNARTQIAFEAGRARRADVQISMVRRSVTAELVAHELEHILEQLDGVDLRQLAASPGASRHGVRNDGGSHYETERARHVGLKAAAEYNAEARPSRTCAVHP